MKSILIALTVLLSVNAFAQCPGDSTAEMNECSAQEFKQADAQLNTVFKAMKASAQKTDAENAKIGLPKNEITNRLVAAEKAWITLRDTSCNLEGIQMLGGSGESVVMSGCLVRKTQERTKELIQLKNDLGL